MVSVNLDLSALIGEAALFPALLSGGEPWHATARASELIARAISELGDEFLITNQVAVHREATIEPGVVMKGPIILSKGCFVAAHAYLRGGVFLAEGVTVGPGCEVKSSFIFRRSALAHFNFVGDSIIGSNVNLEAGSILANHYNERDDKEISVRWKDQVWPTGSTKFGALVGDHTRIGANAVTSPGTILAPRSVVGRLTLVDQTNQP